MNRLLIVGIAVLGLISVTLSLRASWFDIPVGFTAAGDHLRIVTVEPWSTPFYKMATLVVVAYTIVA